MTVTRASARRRRHTLVTLAALAAAVTLMHLWLAGELLPDRLGEGAADTRPRRIEVAFVRELAQAPPAATPRPVLRQRPRVAPTPPAASASQATGQAEANALAAVPLPRVSAPDRTSEPTSESNSESNSELNSELNSVPPLESVAGSSGEPALEAAPESAPPAAAAQASAPDAAAPPLAAFDWPPSTRLSYRLTGNYRGPVEGQAQVEWLRSGTRYQVQMEVSIGPVFAPLMSRRVVSEGEITPEGLRPSRYDEETRIVLREARRLVVFLDADRVRLANGSEVPRPPGVQDSASQFVQLTWLFTTRPELLQPGASISLPLALPRRVQDWVYDVQEPELLATPAGMVPALRVQPRRGSPRSGDLAAEMWVAPSLQYLPVRIVIRQDEQTYIDLVIERLPLQAEPGR